MSPFKRLMRWSYMERVLELLHGIERISANAKPPGELICFRAAATPLDASGAGPKWNVVIPMGEYHGPTLAPLGGKFRFTAEFFNELVANWKANGSFRVPVRWGHEHETNTDPAKSKDLDRKAANLVDFRVTASGLEGLTDWKDTGRKDVQAGEFDSWSAEFRMRHLNRLTGEVGGPLLTGVGLTNDPFFNLMPPVAASAGAESTDTNPNQEQMMNPEQLKKWALSLGLSADATIEQCVACSNAKLADAEARVVASASNKSVPAEVITAAVKPLEERLIAMSAALEAEKTKGLERDVDAQVIRAKQGDGKLGRAIPELIAATAKDIAKSKGLAASEAFLNALPAHVPIQALGHDTKHEEGTVSAADASVKLFAAADEIIAKGEGRVSRSDALERAIRLNPELAKASHRIPTAVQKES